MAVEVFTPYDHSTATIDLANRRFRKQILPLGSIEYHGRTLNFDGQYHADLERSFRERAYDQVPFQLADHANTHTNDPERTRGYLVDVVRTPNGLDGVFELTERGAEVVKDNPQLGVSVRIIEGLQRGAKHFGRALQHVLGTVNPHVQGMSPWSAVEMTSAVSVTETVDLTDESYQEGQMDPKKSADTTEPAVEISQDMFDQLTALLESEEGAFDESDAGVVSEPEPAANDEDPELKVDDEKLVTAALTSDSDLEARIVELTEQVAAERAARHQSALDAELAEIRATGLAPAVIEAAMPLLKTSQVIDLTADGATLDVSGQAKTVLHTLLDLARRGEAFVDLDAEEGRYVGSDSVQARREEQLANWPVD